MQRTGRVSEFEGVPCMLMRGGTSKGAFFLASDLPDGRAERDDLLLRVMGSPDAAQIDGIGGAHPLTSKVAIVSASAEPGIDVDYLFLQVGIDEATVSDVQTCGNLLAGVGPFALERLLVAATEGATDIRVRLLNNDTTAVVRVRTVDGSPVYVGEQHLDGVPGLAAPIELHFTQMAGSTTSDLLPTGNARDVVAGIEVTCIDNGMPSVLIRAADLGVRGDESPEELERRPKLREVLARIRREAAVLMGIDPDAALPIPKLALLSAPRAGGTISTRTFIPVSCHRAIGVFGAMTVAAGIQIEGAVGSELAGAYEAGRIVVEHPSGQVDARVAVSTVAGVLTTTDSSLTRTARKLFDGTVFPRPASGGQ